MKYIFLAPAVLLAACSSQNQVLFDRVEADRGDHQAYLEELYTKYDSEYIADCFYYEDLVCEFE
jgi:hypothetical protein